MAKIYPPLTDTALEACFFKKRRGRKWHRVLIHYARINVHLAYCGRFESYDEDKFVYAGEWNSGDEEILNGWIDCDICEYFYTDGR